MKTIKQKVQSLNGQFEGNNGQKEANHRYAKSNCSSGINIFKKVIEIIFCSLFHKFSLLRLYATSNAIIPKARLLINIKSFLLCLFGFKRAMYADANQAADKLANTSESALRKIGSILTINNVAIVQLRVNQNLGWRVG